MSAYPTKIGTAFSEKLFGRARFNYSAFFQND